MATVRRIGQLYVRYFVICEIENWREREGLRQRGAMAVFGFFLQYNNIHTIWSELLLIRSQNMNDSDTHGHVYIHQQYLRAPFYCKLFSRFQLSSVLSHILSLGFGPKKTWTWG